MNTYLLNSPVLTAYGEYRFEGPITADAARELLADGFISAIGHKTAADFLSQLLQLTVPFDRSRIEMQPGDHAVILRLMERLPEGHVLSKEEAATYPHELSVLQRTT